MERRCVCPCHWSSSPEGIAERQRADGVLVTDVIEAAVACSCCRPHHVAALLSTRLANSPEPREQTLWVDPDPIRRDTEDGD